jgi:rubrerythrin
MAMPPCFPYQMAFRASLLDFLICGRPDSATDSARPLLMLRHSVWRNQMVTTVGMQDDPVALLNALVSLDYDAVEAYRAAIDRLDQANYKQTLSAFLADHVRHTTELSALVRGLGGTPPEGPGAKSLMTKGKVAMADIAGDGAILRAMLSNEGDTNTAYERASGHDNLPEKARELVNGNLGDERRHKAWLEQVLASKAA